MLKKLDNNVHIVFRHISGQVGEGGGHEFDILIGELRQLHVEGLRRLRREGRRQVRHAGEQAFEEMIIKMDVKLLTSCYFLFVDFV